MIRWWSTGWDLINNNEEPPEDGQKMIVFRTPLSTKHAFFPALCCTQRLTTWKLIGHLVTDFLVEGCKKRAIPCLVWGTMDCFGQEALIKGPCLLTLAADAIKVFIQRTSKGLLHLCIIFRSHVDGTDFPAKVPVLHVAHDFLNPLLTRWKP